MQEWFTPWYVRESRVRSDAQRDDALSQRLQQHEKAVLGRLRELDSLLEHATAKEIHESIDELCSVESFAQVRSRPTSVGKLAHQHIPRTARTRYTLRSRRAHI